MENNKKQTGKGRYPSGRERNSDHSPNQRSGKYNSTGRDNDKKGNERSNDREGESFQRKGNGRPRTGDSTSSHKGQYQEKRRFSGGSGNNNDRYSDKKRSDESRRSEGTGGGYSRGRSEGTGGGYSRGRNEGSGGGYSKGRSEGTGGGYSRGRSEGTGGGYSRDRSEGTGGGYSRGRSEGTGGGYSRGRSEGTGGGYSKGRSEGTGGGYSRGRSEGTGSGYSRGRSEGTGGGYSRGRSEGTGGGYSRGRSEGTGGGYSRDRSNSKPRNSGDSSYNNDRPSYKPRNSGDSSYNNDRPSYKPRNTGDSSNNSDRPSYKPRTEKRTRITGKTENNKGDKKSGKSSSEEIRLNRYIANSGVCSRREADTIIQNGDIFVNGKQVTELGEKVKPNDTVIYKGKRLVPEHKVYILMNKPKGYVTTLEDPHAEHTVIDLLGDNFPERVYPVGRLDKDTTGVLLLTNDGDLTKSLTHPKFERRKIYHVFLDKEISKNDVISLAEGVDVDGEKVMADAVSCPDPEDRTQLGIEIHSGQNRVIRRMMESLGYKVKKLDRVYFAGLTKKNVQRGKWRFLNDKEIIMLKRGAF